MPRYRTCCADIQADSRCSSGQFVLCHSSSMLPAWCVKPNHAGAWLPCVRTIVDHDHVAFCHPASGCCCCCSVQYLQQPERVFAEVYRVLKPGGVAIFTFSNRMFYEKVGGQQVVGCQLPLPALSSNRPEQYHCASGGALSRLCGTSNNPLAGWVSRSGGRLSWLVLMQAWLISCIRCCCWVGRWVMLLLLRA